MIQGGNKGPKQEIETYLARAQHKLHYQEIDIRPNIRFPHYILVLIDRKGNRMGRKFLDNRLYVEISNLGSCCLLDTFIRLFHKVNGGPNVNHSLMDGTYPRRQVHEPYMLR